METPRLLIIDLYNIITRAWHGIAPYKLPDGRGVHAIRGTLATIHKGLKSYPSQDLLIALDAKPTKRLDIDPTYKAHRPPADEDLRAQRKLMIDIFRATGWPVMGLDGWEADDIIASASKLYKGDVIVLSGDRDMLGLCSDRVKVYLAGKDILAGPKECQEIFGVLPEQLCDYKALAGDASDGIPGVPSIGPKTAASLLQKYNNLATVYREDTLATLNPRLQKLLKQGYSSARLSWQLARLYNTLPVDNSWKKTEELFSEDLAAALDFYNLSGFAHFFTSLPLGKETTLQN